MAVTRIGSSGLEQTNVIPPTVATVTRIGQATANPVAATNLALADASILVGNSSGAAAGVALSGDATIADTGAITIANNAITSAKIAANAVTSAKIAAGAVSNSQIDPALKQYASVAITSANILAMNGAPVQILAAPGAGKALLVDKVLFEFTAATQYANGGVVQFVYHGGSTQVTGNTIPATVVTSASNSNTLLGAGSPTNGVTVPANTGIDITNATAAFITGTGTATVQIWYTVVTL